MLYILTDPAGLKIKIFAADGFRHGDGYTHSGFPAIFLFLILVIIYIFLK